MTHYEFIRAMGMLAIFCLLCGATTPTAAVIIGGHLSEVLKDFMQYRKDPLKEK